MDERLKHFQALANEFLLKSKSVSNPDHASKYAEIALKYSQEARSLELSLAGNSILLYIECCLQLRTYEGYLDFCARNDLKILSREDFDNVLAELFPKCKPI